MKKHVKQIISLALASGLIITTLAGCAGTSKKEEAKNETTQSQTAAEQKSESTAASTDSYAPEEGKKYKLSWTGYQIQPAAEDGEILKMLEEKFNVDIDMWNLEEEKYSELLNVRLAAGEVPDLIRIKEPEKLVDYVNQGVLAELPEELLNNHAKNILQVLDENAKEYMKYGKVNGKQFGMPSVSATNIFRLPLVYREDWMKAVGVEKTPETLQEFEDLMYKFAKNDPDGNGKNDTYGCSQTVLFPVFGAYGLNIRLKKEDYFVEKDGKLISSAVAPELKDALTVLNKWYKDGVLDPEFITGENTGGYWALSHAFINGRIGFSSNGNYYHWLPAGAYTIKDENGNEIPSPVEADAKEIALVNPNATWTYGMPVEGPTGKKGIKQYNRLTNFYAIGKLTEKDKGKMGKVLDIFDYVSATPNIDERSTYRWGIEGTHWKWLNKENEEITWLPPFDTDKGYENRIGANLGMDMPFAPKQSRERWAYENGFDKYGIESPIQVGLPKANEYKSELVKIRDEAVISMITGDKPLDYFDEYVEKYMAAGGAEVEKEANEYYNNLK